MPLLYTIATITSWVALGCIINGLFQLPLMIAEGITRSILKDNQRIARESLLWGEMAAARKLSRGGGAVRDGGRANVVSLTHHDSVNGI